MGTVLMGTGEVIHDQLKTDIFETYCKIIEVFDIYHVGMGRRAQMRTVMMETIVIMMVDRRIDR